MSEERRRILEMLEEGKITQEDAARLLDALGEEPETPERQQSETAQAGKKSVTDWPQMLETLGAGVDKVVQETIRAAGPPLKSLGAELDTAMQQVCEAVKDSTISAVIFPSQPTIADPLPLEENAYPAPVEGTVNSLRVEWVNGPVEIRPWEGNTIRVAEYAARELKEGEKMDLRLEQGTLRICWTRGKLFCGKIFLQKHLVVELPQDAFLEELKVNHVSGGSYLREIQGHTMRLSTVSGPMDCYGLRAETLRAESVSGSVTLGGISAREVKVSGTSGKVGLEGVSAQTIRGETVSGDLTVWGNGEDIRLDTVSGKILLQVAQYPKQVKLESVSGKMTMLLPKGEPGFTAKYDSLSGKFFTQFPLSGELGKRKGKAAYLSGGAKIKMDTVSGAMELREIVPQE